MSEHEGPVLTGIKPTGELHIGNYLGAIRPSLEAAKTEKGYFFIADLHALNSEKDPKKISEFVRSVAAAWLAGGLDTDMHVFYQQSDIHEIAELSVILSSVAPKGLLDRAHAYKASVERNLQLGKDADAGVNMGLYNYPILMAADILAIRAAKVPVGRDQVQHIEIAQDLAQAFNRAYGPVLRVPNYIVEESVATIPGIDGRKMSKSYGNTIPLFTTPETWKKVIRKIVTSTEVTNPEDSTVFKIFKTVASPQEATDLLEDLKSGKVRWGDAKDRLYEVVRSRFSEMSKNYFEWMDSPDKIRAVLERGKSQVQPVASETLKDVKKAVGIGS